MTSDIHDYQKRLQQALNSVKNASDISDQDKKLIEEFSTALRAQRLNTGRVAKYVFHLKKSAERLNQLNRSDRGLSKATKDDISTFNIWLSEASDYTPHTRRDYVTTFKRFFQWLKAPPEEYQQWRRKHRYPAEVDDLSSNLKLNERFLPSDLLTPEEVTQLITSAPNLMVKAALAISDEVGPRPGELLNMRIGDIMFQEKRVVARLGHNGGGKTGERLILLVKSVSFVSQWLENHPIRDNFNAPLWVCQSNNNRFESWSYNAFRQMLLGLSHKVKLKKSLTPYLFRHTAATRDACLGFTEPLLCKKYGWRIGSDMPAVYLHLANNDLYSVIAEKYGGQLDMEKPKPQTVGCVRCGRQNHPSQKLCGWCGSPLHDEDIAKHSIELEEAKKMDNEKIQDLENQLSEMQNRLNALIGVSK